MSNFSATVPVKWAGEVNAKLESLGYGPNNFMVPASSAGATMSDFAGLHCWPHPQFQADIEALDPAYGIVITEGAGQPNFKEACEERAIEWKPFDGDNAALPMKGATTVYEGKTWTNLADRNTFAPPVNWREQGTNPAWSQPVGKEDAYPLAFTVTHKAKVWESLMAFNVGVPGVSGWREVVATGYAAWVQPTGASDAYKLGDKVSYKNKNYENLISANVWSPDAYPAGWKVIA